jgi:drug/metabolite transporter (DMT)-like permease
MALVTGAFVWGVIWYPYRVLHAAGIGAVAASVATYVIAFLIGLFVFRRRLGELRFSWLLLAIGLTAGACNLGYVLGTVHGIVMRVLLLFYLAPLWTVLLARVLLDERLDRVSAGVVGVSLAGAVTMLWHAEHGAPWPAAPAEWAGLAAGFLFALSNVLIRRATSISVEVKSMAVFVGVVLLGGALLLGGAEAMPAGASLEAMLLLGALGLVLMVINVVVQFGLMHTAASRAIVILLSELVFAAASAWWLAGEALGWREWVGGGMIVAASLLAARSDAA